MNAPDDFAVATEELRMCPIPVIKISELTAGTHVTGVFFVCATTYEERIALRLIDAIIIQMARRAAHEDHQSSIGSDL